MYKKGDKLIVIDASGTSNLKVGDLCTFIKYDEVEPDCLVVSRQGKAGSGNYYGYRFRLCEEKDYKQGGSNMEVGDKVIVVDDNETSPALRAGEVYTVSSVVMAVDEKFIHILVNGKVQAYYESRFKLLEKAKQEDTYSLKLSSPLLLSYDRMYAEVMVNGTKAAKVTIKIKGEDTRYLLLVRKDILIKAGLQEGGEEILKALDALGVLPTGNVMPLTIKEWATAYELVKKLRKLPLLKDIKAETTVTIETLEV